MESAQIQALYEPPLAAMPQLSKKPRQGFETRKRAWNPGPNSCNFTVTLGLRATVVENGVRETYSARYYNPATGRFMSRDPEVPDMGNPRDPKTLHKYLYAGADPVNLEDPRGEGFGKGAIQYLLILSLLAEPAADALEHIEPNIEFILEDAELVLEDEAPLVNPEAYGFPFYPLEEWWWDM
jgi:RHS repeat-associated protein